MKCGLKWKLQNKREVQIKTASESPYAMMKRFFELNNGRIKVKIRFEAFNLKSMAYNINRIVNLLLNDLKMKHIRFLFIIIDKSL